MPIEFLLQPTGSSVCYPFLKKEDLIHLFGSPDSYSPPNVGYIDIERLVWYRSHDVLILPLGVFFTYLF